MTFIEDYGHVKYRVGISQRRGYRIALQRARDNNKCELGGCIQRRMFLSILERLYFVPGQLYPFPHAYAIDSDMWLSESMINCIIDRDIDTTSQCYSSPTGLIKVYDNNLISIFNKAIIKTDIDSRKRTFIFDHCHKHGYIRGIICGTCNNIMREVDKLGKGYYQEWRLSQDRDPYLPITILKMELPSAMYHNHQLKCPDCFLLRKANCDA
jgi:hypothetical protein